VQELREHAKNWLMGRVELAARLSSGECGGSYGDAILILSALVSGIAAEIWPGERIDRKRFVEVWHRYSGAGLNANLVSLPLLVAALRNQKDFVTAEQVRSLRSDCISQGSRDSLVVTGERVDLPESDVIAAAPRLSLATIRNYTYGSVYYREFRSGYVHQYKTGTHAEEFIMSHTRGDITYSNQNRPPYRRINFSSTWLIEVARSICVAAASDYWDGEQPQPSSWWLDG
jgi:hypothetical protein